MNVELRAVIALVIIETVSLGFVYFIFDVFAGYEKCPELCQLAALHATLLIVTIAVVLRCAIISKV